MRSNGQSATALGGREQVTFGDDCPGATSAGCSVDGLAVHQAVIPVIDEGGDVVMPQYYALCCVCYSEQFVVKYGIDELKRCGCEIVDLQAQARALRLDASRTAALRALEEAEQAPALAEFRQQFLNDQKMRGTGTIVQSVIE